MKTLSTPTLIKLVFSIIVFAFILIILYYIVRSTGYSGRWNCKLAYSIAAPLSLFMNQNAAIQNAGIYVGIAAAVAIGAAIFATAHFKGRVINKQTLISAAKKVLTNKYVVSGIITTAGFVTTSFFLGNMVNSALATLQEPIVKGLCKTSNVEIDLTSWSDLDIERCIKNLLNEVTNDTKRQFIISEFKSKDDKEQLCLAYKLAKYAINTFGETIGTNVRTPFAHTHYAIIVKSNKPLVLTVADLLSVLDMLEINANTTMYEIIYGNSEANADPTGNIYSKYVGSNVKSESFSLVDRGKLKIIGAYLDDANNVVIEDYIIHDPSASTTSAYLILFKYTGVGEIFIFTIKV